MDEALLSLLEKKDFAYVTVKEICEVAGVNRSTFYLHYENTSDLLRETTEYILKKHYSYYGLDCSHAATNVSDKNKKDYIFISREYLVPYLTFIKDNRRVLRISIKHFKAMNMNDVYGRMFKDVFEPILACYSVPKDERPYVIKFYLTGVFAIVNEWLENDCRDDIEFLVKIICDCVMGDRKIEK